MLEHVEARQVRELEIKQDQVRQLGIIEVKGLDSRVRQGDLMTLLAQEIAEQFEQRGLVIDKEDAGSVWAHVQTGVLFMNG